MQDTIKERKYRLPLDNHTIANSEISFDRGAQLKIANFYWCSKAMDALTVNCALSSEEAEAVATKFCQEHAQNFLADLDKLCKELGKQSLGDNTELPSIREGLGG